MTRSYTFRGFRPCRTLPDEHEDKPERRERRTASRADLFGHSVGSIIRWMGSRGWSFHEARRVLAALGVAAAVPTIRTSLSMGKARRLPLADLRQDQVAELERLRHQNGE